LTGWIWIAAIWCAAALFDASQTLLTMHLVGVGKAWLRPFLIVFISWLPWALATPFVIELARRWPIVRGEILKAMSLHLAAFAAVSASAEGWSALLQVIFDPWHRNSPPIDAFASASRIAWPSCQADADIWAATSDARR
jgi:hypothetical protein